MSHLFLQGRVGNPRNSGPAISLITPREHRLLTAIGKATRQLLTEMRMPSIEDVNVMRLARFDDAITAALGENERAQRSVGDDPLESGSSHSPYRPRSRSP
jgi:ATP-dependent RNA helicase DeaD